MTVAQRACGKCDATTLHIVIRSDLTRDGAERRDGARKTWIRWLQGLEGVSYQFFVVDAHDHNRTGLQNDLVKEHDLHKDVGVEVLSRGDRAVRGAAGREPDPEKKNNYRMSWRRTTGRCSASTASAKRSRNGRSSNSRGRSLNVWRPLRSCRP